MNSGPRKPQVATPALSRRKFLAATATSVAGFSLVPRHVLGGPKFVAPSEKVNLAIDRKSTRLNSSHANISYAVFCLKKKKDYPISKNQQDIKIPPMNAQAL